MDFLGIRTSQMFNAIKKGDEKRVEELINKGVNPNATKVMDATGTERAYGFKPPVSALGYAAEKSTPKVLEVLLEKGAVLDAQNNPGFKTPLMEAVVSKKLENVSFLVEKGANPNLKDFNGYNALMHAVTSPEMTSKLLSSPKLDLSNVEIHNGSVRIHSERTINEDTRHEEKMSFFIEVKNQKVADLLVAAKEKQQEKTIAPTALQLKMRERMQTEKQNIQKSDSHTVRPEFSKVKGNNELKLSMG